MIENEIPGYQEVLAAEQEARDLAFLDFPETVCGVPILPLDLRNLTLLTHARNPFIIGGTADLEDARMVLYLQSPLYVAGSADVRTQFLNNLLPCDEPVAVAEVRAWIDRTFADAPPGTAKTKGSDKAVIEEPIASFVASWIDLFGSEYGYSREEIVGTATRRGIPLPQMYQLHRMIARRHDPKKSFTSNRVARLLGDWLRASIAADHQAAQAALDTPGPA